MRLSLSHLTVFIALLTILPGCNQSKSPADASSTETTAVAEAPTPETTPAPVGAVFITPAQLPSCEPGAVVTVHWDLREIHPEVTEVEIWTGPAGNQTLFAAGGFAGEASTEQPWARPGTAFSVRNKADGEEVANVVVGGPSCVADVTGSM